MALSAEQITVCNLALGLIGEVEVASNQTTTKQYKLCDRFYVSTLKETLVEHNWNEHKKRVMLLEDSTAPLFGYDYRFALPTDCMKLLRIGDGDNDWTDWEVEDGYILTNKAQSPATYTVGNTYASGQYISYSDVTYLVNTGFTATSWSTDASYVTTQSGDYSVLYVEYIYYNTDTTSWSPRFLDAMVHNLAIKLVVPITNNPKNMQLLLEKYENLTLRKARSVDAQQGKPKTLFKSLWWNSRYGS